MIDLLNMFLGQVPARLVLYMLSWSGFLVSFMMRTDINLAIVAMVEDPAIPMDGNSSLHEEQYCYDVSEIQNDSSKTVCRIIIVLIC